MPAGAASFMFDFPLKGVLNEAASKCEYWRLSDAEKKAPGLNGWWPERSCTFVDNHDTYETNTGHHDTRDALYDARTLACQPALTAP